jgi:uncharacterized membrane protein
LRAAAPLVNPASGEKSGQLKGLDAAMNATAIVTFPNSNRAFEARKALEASSGSMVYGSVVATRDLNGNLFLNETTKDKVGGTIGGAFIGGLAGLPLGAVAVILGAIGGALIGGTADFLRRGDDAKFVKEIGRELAPGKTLLVIDFTQNSMADFDALMKSVGGTVVRNP